MRAGVSGLLCVFASLFVFACGGNGEEPRSKADFIRGVDAACKRVEAFKTRAPSNQTQAKLFSREELEAREKAGSNFERAAIDPPEDIADDVNEFKRKNDDTVGLLKDQVAAADADRQQEYERLARRLNDLYTDREQVADRIGFKVCGQPATAPPSVTGGGSAVAQQEYRAALRGLLPELRAFRDEFKADVDARNLQAAMATGSKFRDAMFNFDKELRKIDFPPGATSLVDELLEANRDLIADLDALGPAGDQAEFNRVSRRIAADLGGFAAALRGVNRRFE
jgi:hypothetical protein